MNKNKITLIGTFEDDLSYLYEYNGEKFYTGKMVTMRMSHTADICDIVISERLIETLNTKGRRCEINGSIRTRNEEGHLIVYVFAESMTETDVAIDFNVFEVEGFICKEPILRSTPQGRNICDIILASNRGNAKSDYLPCIAWSRCAKFVGRQAVGTKVEVSGRLQSRMYNKKINEELSETRTAYELSICALKVGDDE